MRNLVQTKRLSNFVKTVIIKFVGCSVYGRSPLMNS